MRLLVVEDDQGISDVLRRGFLSESMAVDLVRDGVEGFERAARGSYDAVILDLMLPGMNGLARGSTRDPRTLAGGISSPRETRCACTSSSPSSACFPRTTPRIANQCLQERLQ